ncbi:phosphorelay protein [Thiocystis violacea]|nr:phosphorelay protein [Thiocystis violacea]
MPSSGADLAVHDQAAALEYAGGDAELAADLMAALLDGLPDEIESLKACLAESDWPGLAEYAHQVRGATSYCGVPALDAAMSALERAARVGDPARCRTGFDAVLLHTAKLFALFKTPGDLTPDT